MDKNLSEEKLDRLITKAEKLKSILMECENFVESLDDGNVIERGPNIVYNISLGDMGSILKAPMGSFSDDFNKRLEKDLPKIFIPREVVEPKSIDLTKSGNYKKPQAEA